MFDDIKAADNTAASHAELYSDWSQTDTYDEPFHELYAQLQFHSHQ